MPPYAPPHVRRRQIRGVCGWYPLRAKAACLNADFRGDVENILRLEILDQFIVFDHHNEHIGSDPTEMQHT